MGARKSSGPDDMSGSVFQKRPDLALDIRDLVKAEMRVCDDYRLSSCHMFVNEHVLIATLNRAKHFFTLKHESKNVACVFVGRIIPRNQAAEETLGIVLGHRLGSGGGWWFVFRTPEGKGLDVVIPILPSVFAKVFAAESISLANQERVKVVTLLEFVCGASAGVGA
jgi:hypothetical protein